jgi:hypothetical protein
MFMQAAARGSPIPSSRLLIQKTSPVRSVCKVRGSLAFACCQPVMKWISRWKRIDISMLVRW